MLVNIFVMHCHGLDVTSFEREGLPLLLIEWNCFLDMYFWWRHFNCILGGMKNIYSR